MKKGYSTDLLLVKVNEDQSRALDKNLTVRNVFVRFRQAFDSISPGVILDKLQTVDVFCPFRLDLGCHRDLFWVLLCYRSLVTTFLILLL